MQSSSWKPVLITCGILAGIGLLLAGCLIGGVAFQIINRMPLLTGPRETQPVAVTERAVRASATPLLSQPSETLAAVVEPSATPTPAVPTRPVPNQIYNGFSFYLDPALAAGIDTQTIPAQPPSSDSPPWDVAPLHTLIKLNGYALSGTFHTPSLYIYPAAEYAQMSDEAGQIITRLRKQLETRPQQVDHVPFLPFFNAGQMMHVRMAYLDFRNGSGVRFLTQYGQDVSPINNASMFYTFQGLTQDGKFYISAILPISSPILPAKGDISTQDYEALSKDYQGYLAGVTSSLESQLAGSFHPDLNRLDALIQSIEIK